MAVSVLLAFLAGYILIWAHEILVHEGAGLEDECAVCSWANGFNTGEVAEPPVAMVPLIDPAPTPPLPALHCSYCWFPFSARSPPRGITG